MRRARSAEVPPPHSKHKAPVGNSAARTGSDELADIIPKLEDPDSCYVRRHWDIHCKNVRRSNGIWAPCSSADDAADESMSPQFGITPHTAVEPICATFEM